MADEDILIKVAIAVDEAKKEGVEFLDDLEKKSKETGSKVSENLESGFNKAFGSGNTSLKKTESGASNFFKNLVGKAKGFLSTGISVFKKFDTTVTSVFINIGRVGAASLAAATAGITLVLGAIAVLASKFFKFASNTSQATDELRKKNEENKKQFQDSVQKFKDDLKPISAAVGKIAQDMISGLNKIFQKLNESGKVERFVIGVAATITGIAEASKAFFSNVAISVKSAILEVKIFSREIQALLTAFGAFVSLGGFANPGALSAATAVFESQREAIGEDRKELEGLKGSYINVFDTFKDSSNKAKVEYTKLADELNKKSGSSGRGATAVEAAIGSLEYLRKILSDLNKELEQANPNDHARIIELTADIRGTEKAIIDLQSEYDALLGKVSAPIKTSDVSENLKAFEAAEEKRLEIRQRLAEQLQRDQAGSRDFLSSTLPAQTRSNMASDVFIDEFGLNIEAADLLPDTLMDETRQRLNTLRDIFTNGDIGIDEFLTQVDKIKDSEALKLLNERVGNLQEVFGSASTSFASWTKVFKEGSKEQEVAAKAQLVAQTALSISNQVLTISTMFREAATESGKLPFPANLVVLFTIIGAIGQVLSTMQALTSSANKEFYEGGYTGRGDRRDIAGLVHKEEFVSTAEATRKNRSLLEGLHTKDRDKIKAGIDNLMLQYNLVPTNSNAYASNNSTGNYRDLRLELVGLKKEMQENNRYLRRIERKNTNVENKIVIKQYKHLRRG